MVKFRTLKNSYLKSKENYTHEITEEEALNRYMVELIQEVESVPEGERVYYTEEEFWKLIEEMEKEDYGEAISCNIRQKYA